MAKIPLVILAAGKGTRLEPLTSTTPKPLIKIYGKPLIGHSISHAKDFISKVILVVGHQKEDVQKAFGAEYEGIPIEYVEQTEQKGTAHAIVSAKENIGSEAFYAMYGDAVLSRETVQNLSTVTAGMIVKKQKKWQGMGVVVKNNDGSLAQIVEKPETFVSDLVNAGFFRFDSAFLDTFETIHESTRGEFEITDMIAAYAKNHRFDVLEMQEPWLHVTYPWDLLTLAEEMQVPLEPNIEGVVEEHVVIKGKVALGKGSVIKSGTYIEADCVFGENCEIGPNAYLRGFVSAGDRVKIGASVEVKNSILGSDVKIPHLSYIGDSIIGNNANLSGGTITGSLRHDHGTVKSLVKGELVDTGRTKFGTVVGDNAKTGIHTSIYPGRKIGAGKTTLPGSIITEDVV